MKRPKFCVGEEVGYGSVKKAEIIYMNYFKSHNRWTYEIRIKNSKRYIDNESDLKKLPKLKENSFKSVMKRLLAY